MNPRVKTVEPIADYKLIIVFTNDERRVFDVQPYLDHGVFKELKDTSIFDKVKVFNGSVLWPNDVDLCPDTLYEDSEAA